MNKLIYTLFIVSGFSGLLYEVVWARYLKIFLGHSSYGQILTLIIYMGGISIGSFLGAKYAKNSKNPLLLYSLTEFLIGVTGLLYHKIFTLSSESFFNFILNNNYPSVLINSTKILISMLITVPSAILLGATFPFVATALIRASEDKGKKSISFLYFFNSLGASISVLLGSYLLIPNLGTEATISLAGLFNIIISVLFYFISKKDFYQENNINNENNNINKNTLVLIDKKTIYILLFISTITGLSSFIYEVSWIRLISLILGSSTHSFDIMISTFILGLAFGGLFSQFLLNNISKLIKNLSNIQILMGIFSLSTIYFYEYFFYLSNIANMTFMRNNYGYIAYSVFKYLLCVLIMFPTTFLAGMTLPIITYYLFYFTKNEKYTGNVYGWNTIGAILGAISTGLFLIPIFQLKNTLLIGGIIDIVLGLILLFYFSTKNINKYVTTIISLILIIPAFYINFNSSVITSGVFRNGSIDYKSKGEIIVRDGKTATISVSKDNGFITIKTNGKPDATILEDPKKLNPTDEITMSSLAFYPMNLINKEYNAAIIGFGSGMTAHTLLLDPFLKKLDLIEIEEEIYNLSKNFIPHNKRAYEDKRINMIFDDAKTFFYSNKEKYDIIISEPSNPWVSGVSSLFTDEFYKNSKNFIKKDGYLVQWIHIYEFSPELLLTIFNSMDKNFDNFKVYNPKRGGDLIIIASDSEITLENYNRLLNNKDVNNEINEINDLINLEKNIKFFSDYHYLFSNKTIKPLLNNYNSNSDFYPVVDSRAEKDFFLKVTANSFMEMFYSSFSNYQTLFEEDFSNKSNYMYEYENYMLNKNMDLNLNSLYEMLKTPINNNNINDFNLNFYKYLYKTNLYQKDKWIHNSNLINSFKQKFSAFPKERIIFDLFDYQMTNNSNKIKEIIPIIAANFNKNDLDLVQARILIINSLKYFNYDFCKNVMEKFILENTSIEKIEKEYIISIVELKKNK
ncbi:MAG: fused MFS/spermidine synthase [Candidatus Sericytochromatia bacterium]